MEIFILAETWTLMRSITQWLLRLDEFCQTECLLCNMIIIRNSCRSEICKIFLFYSLTLFGMKVHLWMHPLIWTAWSCIFIVFLNRHGNLLSLKLSCKWIDWLKYMEIELKFGEKKGGVVYNLGMQLASVTYNMCDFLVQIQTSVSQNQSLEQ